MIPIITIEGATAVGKSALAIQIASALDTEIISADSRQVYKHLNIGTAKPDREQQEAVVHHLIDVIELDQIFNAGLFIHNTKEIAEKLTAIGKIPIVCGGTGLYIKSMLEGLFVSPAIFPRVKTEINDRMGRDKLEDLYRDLQMHDPAFAARISPCDKQRIQRGLEVFYSTGKPISVHWQEQGDSNIYKPFRILVEDDRAVLYSRIDMRVQSMIKAGLLEEIRALLDSGYSDDLPGLKTLGYKEFIPYLRGERKLDDCIDETAQRTRNYAKRQLTWYRKYDFHLTLSPSEFRLSDVLVRIHGAFDLA